MSAPDPGFGVRDLRVRLGGRDVLDGVFLDAPRGAVACVTGGDGAGKTTLLRALVGQLPARTGEVRRPPREHVGYLPAGTAVYKDLTVAENLDFVATAYGLRGRGVQERRADLLGRTGLAAAAGRLGGQLSGGMRQKLGLAMALLPAPELLVLDEPTTGVDPVSRAELARLVARAAAAGAAVVLATTYLDEAERAASVLVLDAGRPLLAGSAADLAAAAPAVRVSAARPPGPAWRRADGWHAAAAGGGTGPGGGAPPGDVRPGDLTDAVMVASLAAEAAEAGAPGHGGPGTAAGTAAGTAPARPAAAGAAPPAAPGAPVVRASGVVVRFGALTAVDGADLALDAGRVVGLLGANGAGKTTLMRVLLGLQRADAGTVSVFGGPPSREARRRTGYVPQGLGLYTDLTVAENLAFTRAAYRTGGPSAPRGAAVADPGVAAAAGTLVAALPLGLRRRTAFAAVLDHRPELLVLDEPTSGVDPLGRVRLWDRIRAAAEAGAAVCVSTHYLEEAQNCDVLVLMAAGRVVATGALADVLGGRTVVEVDGTGWAAAFAALDAAGLAASLSGTRLRVVDADEAAVAAALRAAGVAAAVRTVPAQFEEAFVALGRPAGGTAP